MLISNEITKNAAKNKVNEVIQKHLDIFIIRSLNKRSLSGYGLISFLHSEYGILIGAGRVYNRLRVLEKKRILKK